MSNAKIKSLIKPIKAVKSLKINRNKLKKTRINIGKVKEVKKLKLECNSLKVIVDGKILFESKGPDYDKLFAAAMNMQKNNYLKADPKIENEQYKNSVKALNHFITTLNTSFESLQQSQNDLVTHNITFDVIKNDKDSSKKKTNTDVVDSLAAIIEHLISSIEAGTEEEETFINTTLNRIQNEKESVSKIKTELEEEKKEKQNINLIYNVNITKKQKQAFLDKITLKLNFINKLFDIFKQLEQFLYRFNNFNKTYKEYKQRHHPLRESKIYFKRMLERLNQIRNMNEQLKRC